MSQRQLVANRSGAALKQVRVNFTVNVDSKAIRRERRNGRDVIIVPSATLPDNIVMNGILYPAEEIEKSFATLERTLAPLGHPVVNGKLVSANDPEALNAHYFGAWNENVRRKDGRVFIDKVIDVEVANSNERGKRVIAAIESGKPIHTSTGLLTELEPVDHADYRFIARNMAFDHDAVLLDEPGAATPEQGVGMLVNSGETIEVINSVFEEDADREMGWGLEQVLRAAEKKQRASLMERVQTAVLSVLEGAGLGTKPAVANKEADMISQEKFDALSSKVEALAETVSPEKISEAIATAVSNALKPVLDAQEAAAAAQKAKEEAEKAELVQKVVNAKLLPEDTAKELTLNALRALAPKAQDKPKAFALNAAESGGQTATGFVAPKGDA